MNENIFTPVTSITKSPVNTGGLCKIIYFKIEDVLTWPSIDPGTGILSSAIQLKPGASFYFIEGADKGRNFKESKKNSSAGSYYDIEVNIVSPGNTTAIILSLQTMDYHQFGVIVNDRDGNQRLIGNKDSGATLIHDYDSGDVSISRKRQIKFTWQNSTAAPVYSAQAFTIAIGGVSITAGTLTMIIRFRVGDPGAPMNDTDTTLSSGSFANKNLLVLAGGGQALPCDDDSGSIDWTDSIERHYEKILGSNTITFVGGVTDKEIIEIYAWS